ncbi:MAG: tryptophan synthase subunit alpha [Cellulomonadaceae bacterium]
MSVATRLQQLREEGRPALIGYFPVGFPDVDRSIAAIETMIDAGVDAVELGLPYSDPVMDGATIQAAVDQALHAGTRVRDVFRVAEAAAAKDVPVLVMSYYNPILHYGVEAFARDLAAAGGCGLITPDLIPDEAHEWIAAADAHDLDKVFLVAPSSTTARLEATAAASRGFVYAASTMGVTGERTTVGAAARDLVARTRAAGAPYVCVGLGVSRPEQAAEVGSYADGVIVGSAFVRPLLAHPEPAAGLDALRGVVTDLAGGVREARGAQAPA